MASGAPYYLGIDGGGTGCRARVVDADGRVLGSGTAGPASLRLGADTAWAALMAAAGAALTATGLDPPDNEIHAGIGVAGVGRTGALEQLLAKAHPYASLTIANDAVTACLGAHRGLDGGIVIVGTGSVGFGRVAGREVRVGGWGFPVSDDGSGAWLGLNVVRMALDAHDERRAMTPLLGGILAGFGGDPYRLVDWMERASATDYATLAPQVVTAAAGWDEAAHDLMRRAARHIDALVETLADRGVPRVALLGGLAGAMEPWLASAARAQLVAPAGDSIDGALQLAGFGR